ncbi:MAG: SAF domain-containing protein [Acidimicrobiia bacterium]
MTATLASHQPASPLHDSTSLPAPPGFGGRRNRTRIAFGLVVIVVCVLATASLFSSANNRSAVLTVARTVPAGHAITSDDLTTARVSVGVDVPTMAASERDVVVGRVAAVTLIAGSLLLPADVSVTAGVPVGMAIVGASLKPGQYPVSLTAGDHVDLVETASPSAVGNAPSPVELGAASVLDVEPSQDGSDTLALSLLVPDGAAANVAGDGAAGQLSVMVVGG